MDCKDEPIKITMLFLLAKQGAETYPMTPDQFGIFISDEIKKWAAVSEASIGTSDLNCTHQVARLTEGYVIDDIIECSMHNGRFHIPTGRVDGPPACEPLRVYPVKLNGIDLMIEIAD